MNVEDLVGAKIISIERAFDEIHSLIVEKDNKHIKICGTEEYPWISYWIDKYFCPKCRIELDETINKEKHYPEYICKKCGYKE